MSIGDILSGVGSGLVKGAKVAGAVLEPLGKRTAEVLSGEAPQIDEEKRQQAQKGVDAQVQNLEQQLEMGRKYGTLNADQQKQYVDSITKLYSHPSQMGDLVSKLHKIVHPDGTKYQSYSAPLKNPVPEGGTNAQDEAEKLKNHAAQNEQDRQDKEKQTQDSWSFFSKYIPQEELPKAQSEWAMKNLGIAQTLKNIPGAAGQPIKGQDGRYYRPMQQGDGSIVQEPMPPDWTPGPAKAPVTKTELINGKSYIMGWNPETQKFDRNMGEAPPNYAQVAIPLADERAKAAAKYGVQEVTDEKGNLVNATRLDVVNRARSGNPYSGKEISTPVGAEKTKQDFALSGIMQVQTLRDIIKRNKDLFGPAGGRAQDLAAWIGSSSPDAQRFRTAALILADHSAGVFGGRAVQTVNELKDTITSMHLNPDALLAGLDQDEKTFQGLAKANGRLPQTGASPVRPGSFIPKTGAQPNVIVVTPEDMK
jgi:hypothetical protein